ncbi:unnamed protein product [marine sediment metagenome]|uniref:Uncharacterized protein n=1 Tax=marine sediment metagenome TaxID=412755 RepID=X1GCW0_9ZZZZ
MPANKVFIVGRWSANLANASGVAGWSAYLGESDATDAALSKTLISRAVTKDTKIGIYEEIFAVFSADKYVTASSEHASLDVLANTSLYGVEVNA